MRTLMLFPFLLGGFLVFLIVGLLAFLIALAVSAEKGTPVPATTPTSVPQSQIRSIPTPRPQTQVSPTINTPAIRPTSIPTLLPSPTPTPRIVKGSENEPYAYEVLKHQGSQDPKNVLGKPDEQFLSLGGDGRELDVRVGKLINGPGHDLLIVECGKGCNYPGNPKDEPYDVFVWAQEGFRFIGRGNGTTAFDLDEIGVQQAEIVRIVDRGRGNGRTPGADIDAVVALQSTSGYEAWKPTPRSTPTISSIPVPTPTANPTPIPTFNR